MAGEEDKARLIAEIAAARAEVTEAGQALENAGTALKEKFNLPRRAGSSYRKHPALWLAGASLVGLLLSRLPARKKVVYVERDSGKKLGLEGKAGWLWGAAKLGFTLAKPLLSGLATQHLASLVQRFSGAPPPQESAEHPEG